MNLGRTFAAAVAGLLLSGCATAPSRKVEVEVKVNDECLVATRTDDGNFVGDFSQACAHARIAELNEETKRLKNKILGQALLSTLDHLSPANKAAAGAAIFRKLAETKEGTPLGDELREELKRAGITEEDLAENKEKWNSIIAVIEEGISDLSAGEVKEAIARSKWIRDQCKTIGNATFCGQQEAPPPAPK